LLAIKANLKWCRARVDKDVDAGAKAKLDEGPWRKRDRQFLG